MDIEKNFKDKEDAFEIAKRRLFRLPDHIDMVIVVDDARTFDIKKWKEEQAGNNKEEIS